MKRQLGFWMLSALVMGNMIGSGIYALPSALASLGTITIFSWIATGVGALLLALVFAELSTIIPKTGGPYVYCRHAFGNYVGFQVVYMYWIYLAIGVGAICTAFTGYLSSFFPIFATNHLAAFISSLSILWIIIGINTVGVLFAGFFQVVMTVLKLVPLLLLASLAIFEIEPSLLTRWNVSDMSMFDALSRGSLLTLWAFLGLESACIPADEVKDPRKNIPRATIFGTLATALIYILCTVAIMGKVPLEALKNSPAPYALLADAILGPWGRTFITLGAICACIGTLNGWVFAQSQVGLAAAQDSLFPRIFGKKSVQGTPAYGLITLGIVSSILLVINMDQGLVAQFKSIITMATLSAVLCYGYSAIAQIIIVKKFSLRSTSIAILAFIYVFWAIRSAEAGEVALVLLFVMLGIPIYACIKKAYELQKDI